MSGKVLIIDRAGAERSVLKAQLETAYFEVLEVESGEAALVLLAGDRVDIILMGLDLKGSCGIATCRRLKSHAQLSETPIVLITAEDRPEQRIAGFEAGADDFLSKPIDELALFARMRSLARFRMLAEELRLREATSAELGLEKPSAARFREDGCKVAIIAVSEAIANHHARAIEARTGVQCIWVDSGIEAMRMLRAAPPDGFIITADLPLSEDRGALCSALSYHGDASPPAVLVITSSDDASTAARCLDQGASDYISDPPDETELAVRLRVQLKKKMRYDQLRQLVQDGLKLSIIDPLTGLYNRRYVDQHLTRLVGSARETDASLTLMMFDIDKFKSVNDRFGHEIGDLALRNFADRLKANLRGVDLIARIGGEEFLVALPGVDLAAGYATAELVRRIAAAATPGAPRITVSAGISTLTGADCSPEDLMRRADQALYQAKSAGRNRVMRHQAA